MNTNSTLNQTVICYYCNESIVERFFMQHFQLCGAVLIECTYKCGAYIKKKDLLFHKQQCSKRYQLKKSASHISSSMTMENKDLEWREKVYSVLKLLRAAILDGENARNNFTVNSTKLTKRLDTIEKATKIMELNIMTQSEILQQLSDDFQRRFIRIDEILIAVEEKTHANFDIVAQQLDIIRDEVSNVCEQQTKLLENHASDVKEIKTFVARENILMSDIHDEHKKIINDLKLELEIRCKNLNELEQRQHILMEKIELLYDDSQRHNHRIEIQQKTIKKLDLKITDTINCLQELTMKYQTDNTLLNTNNLNTVVNGRLLWRIDKYKEKMTVAKESNTILFSPVFFNKDYGYALQLELFLNGRDRWKDRNIIGCLKVVDGPWDPLLDWPCVLRATVTLRDQDNPANNIRKILKTKTTTNDDSINNSGRDSAINMFIPHTTLCRYSGFTRNNIMFLDIQVTELRGSFSTSSLNA